MEGGSGDRVGVVGVGNVLMGDDGVGPHVVKVLEASYEFPPLVELVDLGTPGADLPVYLRDYDVVVVVDALDAEGEKGEVRVVQKAQLLAARPSISASPHEPGLREALHALELHGGRLRDVRLVGVVAAEFTQGAMLSRTVRAAVPRAVEEVLRQLASLGVSGSPRVSPSEPDVWWERPTP